MRQGLDRAQLFSSHGWGRLDLQTAGARGCCCWAGRAGSWEENHGKNHGKSMDNQWNLQFDGGKWMNMRKWERFPSEFGSYPSFRLRRTSCTWDDSMMWIMLWKTGYHWTPSQSTQVTDEFAKLITGCVGQTQHGSMMSYSNITNYDKLSWCLLCL